MECEKAKDCLLGLKRGREGRTAFIAFTDDENRRVYVSLCNFHFVQVILLLLTV